MEVRTVNSALWKASGTKKVFMIYFLHTLDYSLLGYDAV
jgi:hypothetical protein